MFGKAASGVGCSKMTGESFSDTMVMTGAVSTSMSGGTTSAGSIDDIAGISALRALTAELSIPTNKNTEYFMENYPGVFLSPHKSYLVNPIHIRNIRRFDLILDTGKTLSIPEKKYTKFKAEFTKWMDELNKQ